MNQKITDYLNGLNDLKIIAGEWLDETYGDNKEEYLELTQDAIEKINILAEVFDPESKIVSEETLVKNICQYAADSNMSPEECALHVGVFAIAFDILTSKNSRHGE